MTDKLRDGGPAFPMASDVTGHQPGMTLRDWFAGQALGAVVGGVEGHPKDQSEVDALLKVIATTSYQIADAMLAAREAAQ